MYHLFSLNQFCASFTILKRNQKTDYCSWNEEVSLHNRRFWGRSDGFWGTSARQARRRNTPKRIQQRCCAAVRKREKKSCSINQKQQPKSYKLRGIVLTITLDLLAVSAFSLIKSLNVFKFPYLAATCTAVSPFCR